ncbi:hypothetical protein [Eubacterium callanderi]|uniref:hypothetical protein n=1 Tax=Eubacterium callanderi TaxID=53442 RepID=UPI0022E20696|nr:hypothetical protein [Eubacterium callanderi]
MEKEKMCRRCGVPLGKNNAVVKIINWNDGEPKGGIEFLMLCENCTEDLDLFLSGRKLKE